MITHDATSVTSGILWRTKNLFAFVGRVFSVWLSSLFFVLAIDLTAAHSCDRRVLFTSWPKLPKSDVGKVNFKAASGTNLEILPFSVAKDANSDSCVVAARVITQADDKRNRAVSKKQLDTVEADRADVRSFIVREVVKICNAQKIEISDNVGSGNEKYFMPYYYFARSDGSLEGVPFMLCGP